MTQGESGSYGLIVSPSASRALHERLPEAVAAAVMEFLTGDLRHNPYRVGKPVRHELTGSWSARRGLYRVIYQIDDSARTVRVTAIFHRGDAYRRRSRARGTR